MGSARAQERLAPRGAQRRGSARAAGAAALGALAAWTFAGCVPTQVVQLQAEPTPDAVYVNGQLQGAVPDRLELPADRHHTLFFKKEGYRAELVVLEPTRANGETRLEPGVVRVRLQPVGSREGAVEIDLDEDEADADEEHAR